MTSEELSAFDRRRADSLAKSITAQTEEFKRWRRRAGFGFLLLLIGVGWAVKVNSDAINDIETERNTRQSTVAELVALGCTTDNGQDTLLATLIGASTDEQNQFGAGLENNTRLTEFDQEVVASITRIQRAQQQAAEAAAENAGGGHETLQEQFDAVLKQLRDTEDCVKLVNDYLAGKPIDVEPNVPGQQGVEDLDAGTNPPAD